MILYIKETTIVGTVNKLLRKTQRIEITKLKTKTVTIRNVFKNKQIIEVASGSLNRCMSRI